MCYHLSLRKNLGKFLFSKLTLPLGHNYGCHHNPEVATNSYFSYGHGHLIDKGNTSTGYRTILAYNAAGHSTRVNYYSNPSMNYPFSQTATGVVDLSDNARVITQNRFAFASLGNETAACCDNFYTTTTTTTTTTTSPSTTGNCGNCIFPFIYSNRIHDRCTSIDGDSPWCSTAVDNSGVHISGPGHWEYCTNPACPGMAANPAEVIQPHPQNVANPCCKYTYDMFFIKIIYHIV